MTLYELISTVKEMRSEQEKNLCANRLRGPEFQSLRYL